MVTQHGDIDESEVNLIDEEENQRNNAEQSSATHTTPESQVSSQDPIIINR